MQRTEHYSALLYTALQSKRTLQECETRLGIRTLQRVFEPDLALRTLQECLDPTWH